MITILGTGLLGSGFSRALRKQGHDVRAWNRTPERAKPLAADGITVFDDIIEAVRGADRIHIVVSDDAAVDSVLAAAAPGLAQGTLVFDHSTTSTQGALARTSAWASRGITYVHAPVFMGPQNALESTGVMMISGDRTLVARITPLLTPMTGKLVDLGERVDRAAAMKLVGNLFLMTLSAGFMDLIALGQSMSLSPQDVGSLFDFFNPGMTLGGRFRRLAGGDYAQPSWELAMARKDARLMQGEAARTDAELRVLPLVEAKMDEMIARGLGHLDWNVIAKDLVTPD